MRSFLTLLLLASVVLAEGSLTLDPGMYADALREVQANRARAAQPADAAPAPQAAALSSPEAAEWYRAMQEVGTPQADVRLILLLQQLNPLAGVDELAAALQMHRLAMAGNASACAQLAAAFRSGTLPGGLVFIRDARLAQAVMARAVFQLSPPGGQEPVQAAHSAG